MEDNPLQHQKLMKAFNFKHLTELIWTKSIFNLKTEVHHNYLSYLWWILEPLLHMAVFYVVFGFLLNRGVENYSSFLLVGLIPWLWFSKSISCSSNTIIVGKPLMLKVGIPSIFFPTVSLLQTALKQIPALVLLLGFLWTQGYTPNIHWWALFPLIFMQALIIAAMGCATAAVIPFLRDLIYLVPTGLTFLLFVSGIFYSYKDIPAEWQGLFLLNPMAFLIKCYREIFLDGIWPDMTTLSLWCLASIVMCFLVLLGYGRLRYIFPRVVME
jgi:lipopolysaccharide transport system permease protein